MSSDKGTSNVFNQTTHGGQASNVQGSDFQVKNSFIGNDDTDPWLPVLELVEVDLDEPYREEALDAIKALGAACESDTADEGTLEPILAKLKPYRKVLGRAILAAVKQTPLGVAGAAGAAFIGEFLK